MFKCSNVQAFKCSSVQMFKRSSVQVFKRSSVQVFKCSTVQAFKRSSVQMFKRSSVQVFKRSSVQVFKCPSVQVFKCSSVQAFKCSSVQAFKCSNVQVFKRSSVQATRGGCRQLPFSWPCDQFFHRQCQILVVNSIHEFCPSAPKPISPRRTSRGTLPLVRCQWPTKSCSHLVARGRRNLALTLLGNPTARLLCGASALPLSARRPTSHGLSYSLMDQNPGQRRDHTAAARGQRCRRRLWLLLRLPEASARASQSHCQARCPLVRLLAMTLHVV